MQKPCKKMPKTCRECPLIDIGISCRYVYLAKDTTGCWIYFKEAMEITKKMNQYLLSIKDD